MIDVFSNPGSQTLSVGSLSVTLDACDFQSSQDNKLGYTKRKIENTLVDTTHLPFGGASVKGLVRGKPAWEFTWDLILPRAKTLALLGVIQCFEERVNDNLADPFIQLVDQRIPVMEKQPRTRASKGNLLNLDFPDIPAGFDIFYPIFKVSISPPNRLLDEIWGLPEDVTYFAFQLEGKEQVILPITGDEP